MRAASKYAVLGALAFTCGCESCLGLDAYQLVPSDGGPGSGGAGGSMLPPPCAPGYSRGTIFVSAMAPPGSSGTTILGDAASCSGTSSAPGAIEIMALDPILGMCRARAQIAPDSGTVLESAPRVRYDQNGVVYVTGSFRQGGMQLPPACSGTTNTAIGQPPGATSSLFLAKLRFDGTAICTDWTRRAWSTDVGATLRVHAAEAADGGDVAIAGALGGATALFEDAAAQTQTTGTAFVARYGADGSLAGVAALRGPLDATDAALGITAGTDPGTWLVTGTVRWENPACQACAGTTNVVSPANACPPEAGGGGQGGSGGAGGAGGALGSGGAPANDAQNAFVWIPNASGGTCAQLTTYGSDLVASDAQIGYAASVRASTASCGAFVTGLAGRAAWPLGSSPDTALYDAGGASVDGFLAAFDGGAAVGCASGGPTWNIRMSATPSTAVSVGEHVDASRCTDGLAATAFVRNGAGGALRFERCQMGGSCAPDSADMALDPSAANQLVVLGLGYDGSLGWHGAFGPIDAPANAGAGTLSDRALDDFARDDRDYAFVVFTTTGPLAVVNVEPFGCTDLAPGAPAGTYVVALERDGYLARARCEWVRRIGP